MQHSVSPELPSQSYPTSLCFLSLSCLHSISSNPHAPIVERTNLPQMDYGRSHPQKVAYDSYTYMSAPYPVIIKEASSGSV